jgi:hypothetical protein
MSSIRSHRKDDDNDYSQANNDVPHGPIVPTAQRRRRRIREIFKCALCRDRVVISQPFLDLFPLGGEHDALPFHHACSLTVFGHNVGTLVENLDKAVCLGPLKVVCRWRGMVFWHLLLEYQTLG